MTLDEIKQYNGQTVQLTCYVREQGVKVLIGRLELRGEWVCLYYYGMTGRSYYFRKRCRYKVEELGFMEIKVV